MSQIIDIQVRVDTDAPLTMPELGDEIADLIGPYLMTEALFLGGHVRPFIPPKRVSIHTSTYRDQGGFTVRSDRGESIFTRTRRSAERIRDRLRNGEDTRREDWAL